MHPFSDYGNYIGAILSELTFLQLLIPQYITFPCVSNPLLPQRPPIYIKCDIGYSLKPFGADIITDLNG